MYLSLLKVNDLKRRSLKVCIQNIIIKEKLMKNSLTSKSIMTFYNVKLWHLYIIIAYVRQIEICKYKQKALDLLF